MRLLKLPVAREKKPLSTFYSLDLGEVEPSSPEKLYDSNTGAMLLDSPFGWTRFYDDLVEAIAENAISPTHIRYRTAMLIDGWGGLNSFGNSATKTLEARLRRLDLKITYARPHMVVAARALRNVAGELARAGVLSVPPSILLHHMGFVRNPFVCSQPKIRPAIIVRPDVREPSYAALEKDWLPGVEKDVYPTVVEGGAVIAEVSEFNVRRLRREYKSIRVRVPTWDGDAALPVWEVDDILRDRAVCAGRVISLSREPASRLVRRLSLSYWPDMPHVAFCICPEWLQRLNWRVKYEATITYMDERGDAMAHLVWWREGGMVNVDEDSFWGEGTYLQVTESGLVQLESVAGKLQVLVHAQRTAHDRDDGDKFRRSFAAGIFGT